MQRTAARSLVAAALAVGGGSACTGFGSDVPVEDLGDTSDGFGTLEPMPEKAFPEQIDPGFAGRWVGHVENPFERDELGRAVPATFPSGSTEVTLDYRFEGDFFEPVATLVFGAGPGPVAEPGAAYPAGVHHYFHSYVAPARSNRSFRAPVVEGFEYQLNERLSRFAGYDPGRASMLGFTELAAFEQWCSLQAPLDHGDGDFDCLGASGFSGGDPEGTGSDPCIATWPDGTQDEVDCDFAAMCLSDLCRCDAGGCAFSRDESIAHVFLERQGDQIIGTISGATLATDYPAWLAPMGTLRLFRAD